MFWFEQFQYLTIFDVLVILGSAVFVGTAMFAWNFNRAHRWLKPKYLMALIILGAMPVAVAWYSFFVEPNLLVTRRYEYDSPQLELTRPLKIAVIGDMQARARFAPSFVPYVVDQVNQLQPDYIFWVGDLIEADPQDLTLFTSFSQLDAKYGKYAVLGNHDYGDRINDEIGAAVAREVTAALTQFGFVVLKNSAVVSQTENLKIGIGGTDDLWTTNVDFETLNAQLKTLETDANFLLVHQPMTIVHNPEPELYTLTMAGHCHGGQINLLFLNSLLGFPKIPPGCSSNPDHITGFFQESDHQIFVTPGVGSLYIRARLFDKPEISVVNVF